MRPWRGQGAHEGHVGGGTCKDSIPGGSDMLETLSNVVEDVTRSHNVT